MRDSKWRRSPEGGEDEPVDKREPLDLSVFDTSPDVTINNEVRLAFLMRKFI